MRKTQRAKKRWLSQAHPSRHDYASMVEAGCEDGDFCIVENMRWGGRYTPLGGVLDVFFLGGRVIDRSVVIATLAIFEPEGRAMNIFLELRGTGKEVLEQWFENKTACWFRLSKKKIYYAGGEAWVFDTVALRGDEEKSLMRRFLNTPRLY
jgi:hypothetical protein